jgi:hypothetical protein
LPVHDVRIRLIIMTFGEGEQLFPWCTVQIIARPQSANVPWFVSLVISCFVALIGVWIFLSRQMQVALSSIAHAIEQISALPVPRA